MEKRLELTDNDRETGERTKQSPEGACGLIDGQKSESVRKRDRRQKERRSEVKTRTQRRERVRDRERGKEQRHKEREIQRLEVFNIKVSSIKRNNGRSNEMKGESIRNMKRLKRRERNERCGEIDYIMKAIRLSENQRSYYFCLK